MVAASGTLSGCKPGDAAASETQRGVERPIRAVVSIPPLAGLIAPVLGADAEITVMVPPGQSVHTFEPRPSTTAAVAQADAIVLVGGGLENSFDPRQAARPAVAIVHLAEFADLEAHESGHHDHAGHAGHQEHAFNTVSDHDHIEDPHLWLDPRIASCFVRALPARLGLPPQSQPLADAWADEIDAIEAEYAARLAPFAGTGVVTDHAAWGTILQRHGLEIAAVVHHHADTPPSPSAIARCVSALEGYERAAVFAEPQLGGGGIADAIASEAGVPLGTLDPLGDGDYAAFMRANLDALVATLSASARRPNDGP